MNICSNDPNGILVSLDETGNDSHLHHTTGWVPRGTTLINNHTHTRKRLTTIASITKNGVLHTQHLEGTSNAKIFIKYLKDMLSLLPKDKNIYIFLDNARIHHAKDVNKFLEKHQNVTLMYNIAYTPETNPIELIFKDVKHYLKNTLKTTKTKFVDLVSKAFSNVKLKNIKKYFTKALENLNNWNHNE